MTDRYAKYRTVETDERKRKYIGWIEELSLNAWPSHKIELYDGWLLRFSHNYTHRTNSVQQVGESKIPVDEKIRYCESVYHAMHTPCIFKLSPLTDTSFDQLLENRGYTVQHQTETMVLDCRDFRPREAADVEYEFYGRNSGLPSIVGYPAERHHQSDTAPDRSVHVSCDSEGNHRRPGGCERRDGGQWSGHPGPGLLRYLCDLRGSGHAAEAYRQRGGEHTAFRSTEKRLQKGLSAVRKGQYRRPGHVRGIRVPTSI